MTSSKKSNSMAGIKRLFISTDGTISGTLKNPKKMCFPPNTFLKSPGSININTLRAPLRIIQGSDLNNIRGYNHRVNDVNNEDGTIITDVDNALIHQIPIDTDLSDSEICAMLNNNYNRQEEGEQEDAEEGEQEDAGEGEQEGADVEENQRQQQLGEEERFEQEENQQQSEQDEQELVREGEEPNHQHHNPVVCCSHCREERQQFEQLVLRKLTSLIESNQEDNRGVPQKLREVSLLPPMPFNDIERLQRFDNDLRENERLQRQFKGKIQEIGGKNLQKAVKFAMETVMTDQLSQKVVWVLGADNVPKISKFQFPYLIIDVIRSAFDGTKIKTIEERMAEWIRRAGDRLKAARVAADKRRERERNEERG